MKRRDAHHTTNRTAQKERERLLIKIRAWGDKIVGLFEDCGVFLAFWFKKLLVTPINLLAVLIGIFAPMLIGAELGDIRAVITAQQTSAAQHPNQRPSNSGGWFDIDTWKSHNEIFFFLIAWLLAAGWRQVGRVRAVDRNRVYRELRFLYEEMRFEATAMKDDVRCTVWLVSGRKINKIPTRLVQFTNYYPLRSQILSHDLTIYHRNPLAGRSHKVYHGNIDSNPVGIIGKCVFDTIEKHESRVEWDSVPPNTTLEDYLVQKFHFKRRHAKRVTSDRKSFMCASILGSNQELQGILYLDARTASFFDDQQRREQVLSNLPRVASAISDEQE